MRSIRRTVMTSAMHACMTVAMAGAAAVLIAPAGCATSGDASVGATAEPTGLDRLQRMMVGTFSSAAQAAADPDFFDIVLHMAPIQPWCSAGERWLYVEQAVATAADKPYRQRLYRLTQLDDGSFESAVFTMPEPEKYIGAWRDTGVLASLSRADVREREGCEVILREAESRGFNGGTVGTGCASERSGAAYATAEVIVTEAGLLTWDRGFAANGVQVWGAEKGPYRFDRVP